MIDTPCDDLDELNELPLFGQGTIYVLSTERPKPDPAEQVRKIAEEVTGKSFTPPKRRIGFLP